MFSWGASLFLVCFLAIDLVLLLLSLAMFKECVKLLRIICLFFLRCLVMGGLRRSEGYCLVSWHLGEYVCMHLSGVVFVPL